MTLAWANRKIGSRAKNRIWAICTILMLATIPAAIHAQAYYGSIVGNVTDVTGAVIVGAKVTVVSNATDVSFNTVTSSIGAYSLAQLPVGTYTVTITAPNFKAFKVDGVEVHVSTDTTINGSLSPGATTQTVTVEANQIQVETASASVGEVVTGEQMRELPLNGENFVGLDPALSRRLPRRIVRRPRQGSGWRRRFLGQRQPLHQQPVPGRRREQQRRWVEPHHPGLSLHRRHCRIQDDPQLLRRRNMARLPARSSASPRSPVTTNSTAASSMRAAMMRSTPTTGSPITTDTGKANSAATTRATTSAARSVKDKLFFWWNQEWNQEIRGIRLRRPAYRPAQSPQATSAVTGTATSDQCGAAIPGIRTGNQRRPRAYHPALRQSTTRSPTSTRRELLMAQFYPTPNVRSNGLR